MSHGDGNGHSSGNGDAARKSPSDFRFQQYLVDLTAGDLSSNVITCQDYEDVFGGIARGFKLLEGQSVDDAYDPSAMLIMNLGLLSGTDFMTGLRTYFLAYSPLKRSLSGKPSAEKPVGIATAGKRLALKIRVSRSSASRTLVLTPPISIRSAP